MALPAVPGTTLKSWTARMPALPSGMVLQSWMGFHRMHYHRTITLSPATESWLALATRN